ncbi:hypothetical protein MMC29_003825 [Sticta canariensis]|nr:hypothetical protein [Sticta canariensis]
MPDLSSTACSRWDEHFEMLVHHPEHQSITAVLYDSNLIGRDEEIGRVSVPIADLPPGEKQDLWLDLEPPASHNGVRNPLDAGLQARPLGVRTVQQVVGAAASVTPFVRHHKKRCRLHLEATYFRVGADEVKAASEGANAEQVSDIASRAPHGESTNNPQVINMLRGGVLYVKVRKPQQVLPGTPDLPSKAAQAHKHAHIAYLQVRIRVADQEKHTSAVDGVDNPDWEEVRKVLKTTSSCSKCCHGWVLLPLLAVADFLNSHLSYYAVACVSQLLDFALGGEAVDDEHTQVQIEAYDYHWVNYSLENLTWGSRLGNAELPGTGKLSVPLKEVIQQRVISNDYQLPNMPAGVQAVGRLLLESMTREVSLHSDIGTCNLVPQLAAELEQLDILQAKHSWLPAYGTCQRLFKLLAALPGALQKASTSTEQMLQAAAGQAAYMLVRLPFASSSATRKRTKGTKESVRQGQSLQSDHRTAGCSCIRGPAFCSQGVEVFTMYTFAATWFNTVRAQALSLLQNGIIAQADQLLKLLGCRHRLSARALQQTGRREVARDSQQASAVTEAPTDQNTNCRLVHVLSTMLPAGLCDDLVKAFAPSSSFWKAHGGQEPDVPFFSYLHPIDQVHFGQAIAAASDRDHRPDRQSSISLLMQAH